MSGSLLLGVHLAWEFAARTHTHTHTQFLTLQQVQNVVRVWLSKCRMFMISTQNHAGSSQKSLKMEILCFLASLWWTYKTNTTAYFYDSKTQPFNRFIVVTSRILEFYNIL